MSRVTRKSLWLAFAAVAVFVIAVATINLIVLQREKRQSYRAVEIYEPLVEAVMVMDGSITSMLAAARGYTLSQRTEFLAQYDESVRAFETTAGRALALARSSEDRAAVDAIRAHYHQLKVLTEREIQLASDGQGSGAIDTMLEAARLRRSAPDPARVFVEREKISRAGETRELETYRWILTIMLLLVSLAIIGLGAYLIFRMERQLDAAIKKQIEQAEALVAGMADGVMFVDHEGTITFINPAGVRLLGESKLGFSVVQQAPAFDFRHSDGRVMEVHEIPAAEALATGKTLTDVTVHVQRSDAPALTLSMSAVPLKDEGFIRGVVVTFRDITERRRLETETERQAQEAQVIADAGGFFARNIDPPWVAQAIAERVAEALGDWCAVVLRRGDSTDLQVAAIYHRDMASLGSAWSYVYREPLVLGQGMIGQAVSSGQPVLVSGLGSAGSEAPSEAYHPVQMKLASLLIMPLRARRTILGALVIAANDPARTMTDEKLRVAELLAERAAVAVENAQLFEQQVEARRSLEKLSRRTELIINQMGDGIMMVDAEGEVTFLNPAAQKLLGTTKTGVPIEDQAQAYGFRDIHGWPLSPSDLPAAQAIATERPVQDVPILVALNGAAPRTLSMSATPLQEEDRINGAIVTFRDVTERHRFEKEALLQAERARILADAGAYFAKADPQWISQAIAESVAESLSDWAAVILRTPESNELKVAGIHHRDMASLGSAWSYIYRQPLTLAEGLIGQVVSTGVPRLLSNPEGTRVPASSEVYHPAQMKLLSLLVLPLRARREILGALVIAVQEPERVMTEANLAMAELLAERAAVAIENARLYTQQVEARHRVEDLSRLKDEFLSIASHELRTPITSIKGYTQLAQSLLQERNFENSSEYLQLAVAQVDRMSRLIMELLDVSRIETGRFEIKRRPIEWNSFVGNIVQRYRVAAPNHTFQLELDSSPRTVMGDSDRLDQVLGNLLENAVKYSPEGSLIRVQVVSNNDHVATSIADQGIGIPGDEIGQVFERFHRGREVSATNYGGLGLGLYIAKQIIDRHDGEITLQSRQGHGTTFQFVLPTLALTASPSVAEYGQRRQTA